MRTLSTVFLLTHCVLDHKPRPYAFKAFVFCYIAYLLYQRALVREHVDIGTNINAVPKLNLEMLL